MFRGQSGSDGREETPPALFNGGNAEWMPDNSHRQRHDGLAVAYSVWQYHQSTSDIGFLFDYGAELIVEVARLFSSSGLMPSWRHRRPQSRPPSSVTASRARLRTQAASAFV